MPIRVRLPIVLIAAGLALSGCIDIECPAEFARPTSRERWCGHTGDVGTATQYRQVGRPAPVATTTTTTTTTTNAAPMAPTASSSSSTSVTVQPVPPPAGGPTQIR